MVVEIVRYNPSVCTCGEHGCEPQYRVEKRVLWTNKELITTKQERNIDRCKKEADGKDGGNVIDGESKGGLRGDGRESTGSGSLGGNGGKSICGGGYRGDRKGITDDSFVGDGDGGSKEKDDGGNGKDGYLVKGDGSGGTCGGGNRDEKRSDRGSVGENTEVYRYNSIEDNCKVRGICEGGSALRGRDRDGKVQGSAVSDIEKTIDFDCARSDKGYNREGDIINGDGGNDRGNPRAGTDSDSDRSEGVDGTSKAEVDKTPFEENSSSGVIETVDSIDDNGATCSDADTEWHQADEEISSAFGIMSVYCNSELHSWWMLKEEIA